MAKMPPVKVPAKTAPRPAVKRSARGVGNQPKKGKVPASTTAYMKKQGAI